MVNYYFSNGSQQRGVFTFSQLDSLEHDMIESIVNWSAPDRSTKYIFDVAGRSIFLGSPTRNTTLDDAILGEYDGLQLIGAGGNEFYAKQQGTYFLPKSIEIKPVDPKNHAEELRDIVQLRNVNHDGEFEFSYRKYVPLRGMDSSEASKRATVTRYFHQAISSYHTIKLRPGFVVPELVAEGYFPDLKDAAGNELRFQVYRVPQIKRLPSQMLAKGTESNFLDFTKYVCCVSFLTGATLRNIHSEGMAYMDAHIGNLAWIESNAGCAIYATDLGSCLDVRKEQYPYHYHALDIFTYLLSATNTIRSMVENLSGLPEKDIARLVRISSLNLLIHTFGGYYHPEYAKLGEKMMSKKGIQRLHEALYAHAYDKDLNAFVDAFFIFQNSTKF